MERIPLLRERDFDAWLVALADALHGAAMYPLFCVTAVQRDSEASPRDLAKCAKFRPWMLGSAWSAIRRAIGVETAAYGSTVNVPMGDVKALLRALRRHFEKSSVPEQHRLQAQLRQVVQSDFRDVRNYVAALETIFAKLAKMGKVLTDSDKRFYLLEGLSEDFRRGVSGNIYAYETPSGEPADYAKAVQILSVWEDGCAAPARKQQRDLAMPALVKAKDAKDRKALPCIQYSRKGQCRFESRCRFLHIDAPGRSKPRHNPVPERSKRPPTMQGANKARLKNPHFAGRCHKCGIIGHKRVNCTAKDSANVTVDLVASAQDVRSSLQEARVNPRVEDRGWIHHNFDGDAEDDVGGDREQQVDFAFLASGHPLVAWMVDGGSTCHVLGAMEAYGKFVFNRRPASIAIVVGGGGRVRCDEVGDICLRIISGSRSRVCTFLEVRLVPGFGTNLLSGPRMDKAGWGLHQKAGVYTATDAQNEFVFSTRADANGLYFLRDVHPIFRKPLGGIVGPFQSSAPHQRHLLGTGDDFVDGQDGSRQDENVNWTGSRPSENSGFHARPLRVSMSSGERECQPVLFTTNSSSPEHHSGEDHFQTDGSPHRDNGPDVPLQAIFYQRASGEVSAIDLLQRFEQGRSDHLPMAQGADDQHANATSSEVFANSDQQPTTDHWPQCYFQRPCFCGNVVGGPHPEPRENECDQVGSSVEVSQREVRKLMDAHVKYGHRNFRSLAKALNLRMPAKVPFCQACVEAKATRHPKSHSPFPPRALAVRPGFRLHFDPFGPFADRLSDGTYYGFLIVDAYSRVMWLDTMATLKEWFPRLRALLARIEAEKGGSCVVSELACDSAPMFKDNHEFRMFAEKKGIVLLFSHLTPRN